MKRLLPPLVAGLYTLSLVSCHLPTSSPAAATGQLRFTFSLPQQGFAIQKIPSNTTRIELSISGENMPRTRTRSLAIRANQSEYKLNISALPTGQKTVEVSAYNQQNLLASASTTVDIKEGETAQAILELQEVISKLVFELPQALPFDIKFQAQIQGEGLTSDLTQTLEFKKGTQTLDFGALPPGNKELTLKMGLGQGTPGSKSFSTTVNIKSDGPTTIPLSYDKIFETMDENQLKNLASLLSSADLLLFFGRLPQDTLLQLRQFLPQEILTLLLQNPILANILGINPNSTPSTIPSVEPTASPPKDVQTPKLEFLDLHLVKRPLRLLVDRIGSLATVPDPDVIKLLDTSPHRLELNTQLGGAVIRVLYNGKTPPQGTINIENIDDPTASINSRSFAPIETVPLVNDNHFGTLLLFNKTDGSMQTLEKAGRYRVTLTVTAGDDLNLSREFIVTVTP